MPCELLFYSDVPTQRRDARGSAPDCITLPRARILTLPVVSSAELADSEHVQACGERSAKARRHKRCRVRAGVWGARVPRISRLPPTTRRGLRNWSPSLSLSLVHRTHPLTSNARVAPRPPCVRLCRGCEGHSSRRSSRRGSGNRWPAEPEYHSPHHLGQQRKAPPRW